MAAPVRPSSSARPRSERSSTSGRSSSSARPSCERQQARRQAQRRTTATTTRATARPTAITGTPHYQRNAGRSLRRPQPGRATASTSTASSSTRVRQLHLFADHAAGESSPWWATSATSQQGDHCGSRAGSWTAGSATGGAPVRGHPGEDPVGQQPARAAPRTTSSGTGLLRAVSGHHDYRDDRYGWDWQ